VIIPHSKICVREKRSESLSYANIFISVETSFNDLIKGVARSDVQFFEEGVFLWIKDSKLKKISIDPKTHPPGYTPGPDSANSNI